MGPASEMTSGSFFEDGAKKARRVAGLLLGNLVVMLRSAAFVASTVLAMTALFNDNGPAVAAVDPAIMILTNLY